MDPSDGSKLKRTAMIDPALIFDGERPQAIDEWQEVPGIWDAVRFTVDQENEKGQFILTGSVTMPYEKIMHSGAGRIARIRMRPMSLFESGDSDGRISLNDLFRQRKIKPILAELGLRELIEITVRGGWPGNLEMNGVDAMATAFQYLKALSTIDISEADGVKRNPAKVMAVIKSLARNNATMVSNKTLLNDLSGEDGAVSRETLGHYLDALEKLFVLEKIPAWKPGIRSKTRMRRTPKRMLVDPSLAISALGTSAEELIFDLETYGFMFEGLCQRDLSIYADAIEAEHFHYRDDSNLEVDAIIEKRNGDWGAFEIKLGEHQADQAASTLIRLRDKMVIQGAPPPKCLAVITGGGVGHRRKDGVYTIPINSLRP